MIDRINSLGTSTVINGNRRVHEDVEIPSEEKKSVLEPVVDTVGSRLMTQIPTAESTITTVEEAWSAVEKIKATILENRDAAIGAQGTKLAEDILSRIVAY